MAESEAIDLLNDEPTELDDEHYEEFYESIEEQKLLDEVGSE